MTSRGVTAHVCRALDYGMLPAPSKQSAVFTESNTIYMDYGRRATRGLDARIAR